MIGGRGEGDAEAGGGCSGSIQATHTQGDFGGERERGWGCGGISKCFSMPSQHTTYKPQTQSINYIKLSRSPKIQPTTTN